MTMRSPFILWRNRQGAVAPMVAMLGAALVGAAGFALDAGAYYMGNRDLRAATEAAALAAAMRPAQATARARDYLSRNGYDPAILRSVEVGRYCPDAGLAADQRFDSGLALCPGDGRLNAVRIRTGKPSRQYLTRMLGEANPIPEMTATATAARIDEAGVGVTSGALTVANPLVNSVNSLLGALLGVQLAINPGDVEALMRNDVDAGRFFDALAEEVGERGTYSDLLSRTVTLRQLLQAASRADAGRTPAGAAFANVAGQIGGGHPVPLSGLFGLGVWKNMPVGEADDHPALRAGINAYQLFAYAAQRVGGTVDLSSISSALIGNSVVRVEAIATDPMARPSFSFGPAGETMAGTAAVRLQLRVGIPDILGVTANVPLLIEIAPASASITEIECSDSAEQAEQTRVTAAVQTGLVSAFIGKLPASRMNRPFGQPINAADISPEVILGLTVLTLPVGVTAKAALPNFVQANSGDAVFGPGGAGAVGRPGVPGTSLSIGDRSQIGNSVTALLGNLQLGLTLAGISVNLGLAKSQLISGLTAPLTGLLSGVADPLVDNLLAALGIQLGHATVWATGARCGAPVIV